MMNREAREELYDPAATRIKTARDEAWAYVNKLKDSADRTWAKTYLNWFEGRFPYEPDYAVMGLGIADKRRIFDHIGGYLRTGAGYKKGMMQKTLDPKRKRKRSAWLSFVIAHKNMRTKKGLLDLRAISKLWKLKRGKLGK